MASGIKFRFFKLWSDKNIVDPSNLNNDINCICVNKPDYVYLGTTNGTIILLQYEERLASSKRKHSATFKTKLSVGDKCIVELQVVSGDVNYLLVLQNGELTLHDLFTLERKITLPFKGITTFTCNNGEPYYGLCVHIRKKLFVYNFEQGFDVFKEYHLPDAPSTLCWCKNFICIGFKEEYSLLNVMDGTVVELTRWERGEPAIKLLPTDDIILKTKTQGIFTNLKGKKQTVTIPLPPKTLAFGLSFPFLVAMTEDSIQATNLVSASYRSTQKRPNEDDALKCIADSGRRIFVADASTLYILTPSRRNYQCFSTDMLFQVQENPTDETLFKKYMALLLGDTNNPFAVLVSKYALSFERAYGGAKANFANLARANNHALICIKRLYRVVTSFFYDFACSAYRDQLLASIEASFFSKIYYDILKLIKEKNAAKDLKWNSTLPKVHNTTLAKLDVPKKYWLTWESVKEEHDRDLQKMLQRQIQSAESEATITITTKAELFDIDVFTKIFEKKADILALSQSNNHMYIKYEDREKTINISIEDQFFYNKLQLSVLWARVEHHFYKIKFKSYREYKTFKQQLQNHFTSIRQSPLPSPRKDEKEKVSEPVKDKVAQKTPGKVAVRPKSDGSRPKKSAKPFWRRAASSRGRLKNPRLNNLGRARSLSMGLARVNFVHHNGEQDEPTQQGEPKIKVSDSIPIQAQAPPSPRENMVASDFAKSPMIDPLLGVVVGYLEDENSVKQLARSHTTTSPLARKQPSPRKSIVKSKRPRAQSFHVTYTSKQMEKEEAERKRLSFEKSQINATEEFFGRRAFGEEISASGTFGKELEEKSANTEDEQPHKELEATPAEKEVEEPQLSPPKQEGEASVEVKSEEVKESEEKQSKIEDAVKVESSKQSENPKPEEPKKIDDVTDTSKTEGSKKIENTKEPVIEVVGDAPDDVWAAKAKSELSKSVLSLTKTKAGVWERLEEELRGDEPYKPAIVAMRNLPFLTSPGTKLACCLSALETTLSCVSTFWKKHGKDILLGADDLVPIFAWVILKAGLPNIYSEMSFIEDLSQKDVMKGKFGYCFATMQIAIEVVMRLAPEKKKTTRTARGKKRANKKTIGRLMRSKTMS